MKNNKRVLVVDDDPVICKIYQKILSPGREKENSALQQMENLLATENKPRYCPQFSVDVAYQGQEGLSKVCSAIEKESPYAVAFIDIRMPPGWDGMETAKKIREIDPNIEIVIVTAFSDRSREEILKTVGNPEKLLFLRKPFDPDEISQLALSLTEKWNISRREEAVKLEIIRSESRFRALVETTNDFVWETDKSGKFTYCSPLCEDLYGFLPDELMGRTLKDIIIEKNQEQPFTDFLSNYNDQALSFSGIEREVEKKDGASIFIETSGTVITDENNQPMGFRGIDRDITDRKKYEEERLKMERQYRQSQKMEAIGTLAGGIAHDFNNILSGIMGYTQLACHSVSGDNGIKRLLDNILKASNRAANLVNQILTFSRQTEKEMIPINIGPIINETADMLRASFPSTIKINQSINISPENNIIKGDPTQINQMLINICTNGAQSMKGSGGTLEITLDTMAIEKDMLSFFPDMEPTTYLKISISDTGHGMDSETMEKIFEPFYTTKPVGEGTGLGLSVVHGIIKSHGGIIRVYSEPGVGTTFNMFFPVLKNMSDDHQEENNVSDPIPTGTEKILFIDDEPFLKEIGEELLTSLGYQVVATQDSIQALKIFSQNPNDFDIVVTDMTMPDMTGEVLAQKVMAIRPEIPVILCSGFYNKAALKRAKDIGIREYVMKPIDLKTISTIIRNVLDEQYI